MKKRILSLALAMILLISSVAVLSACANNESSNEGSGEVQANLDHLKGLDFGGTPINFIVSSSGVDDFNVRSIYVDEEGDDGDAVNSAIYARNQKIQNMLNVEIVIAADSTSSVTTQAKTVLLGGSSDFDVFAARQYDDIELALEGVVLDLNTLPELGADYIRWEEEYWASSYIDALSFGDKTFWLTGDLCMRYTSGYYAMFVNARLYKDTLESTYGSIYDIVLNKDWTYDKLIEMSEKCYVDANGDDKADEEDQLGLIFPVWDNTNGMAVSAGVMFTRYDENGVPQNAFNNRNATLLSFVEKCNALINAKGVYSFNAPSYSYIDAMELFAAGQGVFVAARLNQAELYLRDMTDDYYVIPCPMLNKDQGAYYTGVHDAVNIYGINCHSESIPASAATLEAMAYESFYTIRPIYYDSFMKFKYTRDEKAAEMIDLMHDNVYTDFVFIWQFADDLEGMGSFLRNNVVTNKGSSNLKKLQDKWDSGLSAILNKINELE